MKPLFYYSIILSLIGIFTLLVLSQFLSPPTYNISNLSNKHLNQKIQVHANITQIKKLSENFYLLTLRDNTGTIQSTLSSPHPPNQTHNLIIQATATQYNNKLQLQIEKITSTSPHSNQ